MIVETTEIDPEEIEHYSPDSTIGIAHMPPGTIPDGVPFDLNRVQAAIAAYRDEIGERDARIGIVRPPGEHTIEHHQLALWSHTDARIVLVCPRVQGSEMGREVEA